VQWRIKPSEELSSRGAEIVAAFEEWYKKSPPRGYKKAERETNRARRQYMRLEQENVQTPATTIEGMLAKIRCAEAWEGTGQLENITGGGWAEDMALSIFQDIRLMAGKVSS